MAYELNPTLTIIFSSALSILMLLSSSLPSFSLSSISSFCKLKLLSFSASFVVSVFPSGPPQIPNSPPPHHYQFHLGEPQNPIQLNVEFAPLQYNPAEYAISRRLHKEQSSISQRVTGKLFISKLKDCASST